MKKQNPMTNKANSPQLVSIPSLALLAKVASEPVITQLSIKIDQVVKKLQMDKCITNDSTRFQSKLNEIAKTLRPDSFEAKTLSDAKFSAALNNSLMIHFDYIRSLFHYESVQNGNLLGDLLRDGDRFSTKSDQTKGALLALDECCKTAHETWEKDSTFLNTLIAPIIFSHIFLCPTATAMDFYLKYFDKSMLKAAKNYIKENQDSIYAGRTKISIDLIFTRLARDKEFINDLISPVKFPYLAHAVFSSNNLSYIKKCWNSASDPKKKEIFKITYTGYGDIFTPAFVSAYAERNIEVMDWLWGLADTLEVKKQIISGLITTNSRSPWSAFLFNGKKQDSKYLKTAIKLAMRDKQSFIDLVEYDNYKLLAVAVDLGNYKLIEQFILKKNTPLDQDIFNRLSSALKKSSNQTNSLMNDLVKLAPSIGFAKGYS